MIIGTPEYLSPEQISGAEAGDASDLYALGIVAYEMFTGRKPFVHDDLIPLMQMHLVTPPEPPRRHAPQLPASLEAVILTLLKKDPKERYASARATADALAAIRDAPRG
jgi:serine/threonine-protein kinase